MISVDYQPENECIAGVFTGMLNPESVKEYMLEINKAARKHDCKHMISDLRKASLHASISGLYYVLNSVVNDEFNKTWRRAIVVKAQDLAKISFYEKATYNRGIALRVFTDIDLAMGWLQSEENII